MLPILEEAADITANVTELIKDDADAVDHAGDVTWALNHLMPMIKKRG
jgi:hypothetical protein